MHILLNTYIQSYINIHISKYNLFSPIMLSVYMFSRLTLTFEIRYLHFLDNPPVNSDILKYVEMCGYLVSICYHLDKYFVSMFTGLLLCDFHYSWYLWTVLTLSIHLIK